jgi:hypothetical protein
MWGPKSEPLVDRCLHSVGCICAEPCPVKFALAPKLHSLLLSSVSGLATLSSSPPLPKLHFIPCLTASVKFALAPKLHSLLLSSVSGLATLSSSPPLPKLHFILVSCLAASVKFALAPKLHSLLLSSVSGLATLVRRRRP